MKGIEAFDPAPNLTFGHSTDVSTVIIQTEGDINILYAHIPDCKAISNKYISNYSRKEIEADQCSRQTILIITTHLFPCFIYIFPF